MTGSRQVGRPVRRRPRAGLAAPHRRLRIGFGALVVALVLLAARLLQLQGLDSAAYAARAQEQRQRTSILPAQRGEIVDRDGDPLAMSVQTRIIYADPTVVGTHAWQVATVLHRLLKLPMLDLTIRLTRADTHYVVLANDVPLSLAHRVLDSDIGDDLGLPGIYSEPDTERVYPGGSLAANVLGIVPNGNGASGAGVELKYDALLAGRPGELVAEYGRGNSAAIPAAQEVDKPSEPGSTLQLTLDRDIQYEAQRRLAAQVRATGAKSGTVIVMNPRTGQVLAMATAPTFDANDPGSAKASHLNNLAVAEAYEPGSVNKVITVAAAMTEHKVTPMTAITVPPYIKAYGYTIHDAETHGTEHLTVAGVLAKSSNLGAIRIAQRMSRATFVHYLRSFGFGSYTGVNLPGESEGILPAAKDWNGAQDYTVPFGQGIAVTALQVASVYSTIADGGVRVTPSIVAGTISPDGKRTPAAEPTSRRVVPAAVAHKVSEMLEQVINDQGTAPEAAIAGYRVAGKTGTAQRANPRCSCYRDGGYTSTFVGYAPADDPKLVVEVVLQKPLRGHLGGQVAAPVFHDVMSFALKSMGVAPTGTKRPHERLYAPRHHTLAPARKPIAP